MYNERAHLYRRTEYRKMNALASIANIYVGAACKYCNTVS